MFFSFECLVHFLNEASSCMQELDGFQATRCIREYQASVGAQTPIYALLRQFLEIGSVAWIRNGWVSLKTY
jgi:homoserine dehydrogenase